MSSAILVLQLENNTSHAFRIEIAAKKLKFDLVTCVTTADARIEWLRRRPDIVLLDVTPNVNEIEALVHWWREHQNLLRTRVIVRSGQEELRGRLELLGVPFWSKGDPELNTKLAEVIAGLDRFPPGDGEETLNIVVTPGVPVRATLGSKPGSEYIGRKNFDLDLEQERRVLRAAPETADWLETFQYCGTNLFNEIFADKISEAYGEAIAKCSALDRLHLRIAIPKKHSAAGMQLLFDPKARNSGDFLNKLHRLSCRISDISVPPRRLSRRRFNEDSKELRVLLIAANVYAGEKLGSLSAVDREVNELAEVIPAVFDDRRIDITLKTIPSENATAKELERAMSEEFDVIHFAGHGKHVEGSVHESGIYVWSSNDVERKEELLDNAKIAALVRKSNASLVFLNSCYGGDADSYHKASGSLLLGTSHAILREGVGSVVAHRGKVGDDSASSFAEEFYRGLAKTGEVDEAVRLARVAPWPQNESSWLSAMLFDQV